MFLTLCRREESQALQVPGIFQSLPSEIKMDVRGVPQASCPAPEVPLSPHSSRRTLVIHLVHFIEEKTKVEETKSLDPFPSERRTEAHTHSVHPTSRDFALVTV